MSPLLPRLVAGRGGLSHGARGYRRAMWLMVNVATIAFSLGIGALRGHVAPGMGRLGFLLGVGGLVLAAWFGLRVRAQTLADRERDARESLTVLLAAQLRDRDEATLLRMVKKGGPAGRAAQLILDGRKERRRPA